MKILCHLSYLSHICNSDLYVRHNRFCSRLLDYPGPEREQAKAMLRELRSRKAKGATSSIRSGGIHTRSKGPVKDNSTMGNSP